MRRLDLVVGTIYARRSGKYLMVRPVLLIDSRFWRSHYAVVPANDVFTVDVRASRANAFTGLLVIGHADYAIDNAEVVAALAALPVPDLVTGLDSDEQVNEQVKAWRACLPAMLRLKILDPRTLLRPWEDYEHATKGPR